MKYIMAFCILILLGTIYNMYYYFTKGNNELVILYGFMVASMILNLGNFYGYLKMEEKNGDS